MDISNVCRNYRNGFHDVSSNNKTTKILGMLKIISYFTLVIPLGFLAIYGFSSLCGRLCKKEALSTQEQQIHEQGIKNLSTIFYPSKTVPQQLPSHLTPLTPAFPKLQAQPLYEPVAKNSPAFTALNVPYIIPPATDLTLP